jgi:hypothetical protein
MSTPLQLDTAPGSGSGERLSRPDRLIRLQPEAFRERFNRRHFLFEHALSDHPLFKLPRLIELARDTQRKRPAHLYYDVGVTDLNERWGTSPTDLAVDDTIHRIETCNAWITLKYADNDPAYAMVLERCMQDILEVSGRELERFMRLREIIIFITSPHRLTTYHIDSECNFLLQLQGPKEINLFKSDDREVLPEQEIEYFWTRDTNAPVYKPHLQHHADVIALRPGVGVHIPINAPHWLRNGAEVSITVSINYHPWESERGDIYRVNYYLRRLRMNPTPPFRSPILDALKRPVGAVIGRARKAFYGPPGNH